jgi:hypothetical protein
MLIIFFWVNYSSGTCSICSSKTNSITRRFCDTSMSTSATYIQNYSRIRTSWLTMMMSHTMLCHCRTFWPQRTWLWSPSLHTHMTKCWSDHIRTFPTTAESHTELWSTQQGQWYCMTCCTSHTGAQEEKWQNFDNHYRQMDDFDPEVH